MRILLLTLICLGLTLAAPPPPQDQIHIPEKCEDVLAVKVCNKLLETAKNLKLKSEEVKAAIIDAVKNGKTEAEDIYNAAQDFLQKNVLSKTCEDFTTPDNCAKLRVLAAKLKIQADKVEEFVIKAVAEGQVKAVDLYNKVVEFYKNEVKTKSCEDFLPEDQCERIRSVADTLKIKADQLGKAFIEAIVKAKTDGTNLFKQTLNNLKEIAKNTSCEDLLNPDVCKKLRQYANATKIAFPKIMDAVLDSIVNGYELGKGLLKAIYDVTDYLYNCEKVFDKSSCERLKKLVGVLGIKAAEIDAIVRKYVREGLKIGQSLYQEIYAYLKEKVFCKINIFCKNNPGITNRSIEKRSMKDLLKKYREMLEKAIPEVKEKIKEYIKQAIAKAKDANEKIKKLLEEAILKGKGKYDEVMKWLKEIFKKQTGSQITKRDIYDKLKEALAKAHGKMKEVIEKLLTMSKELLKKIHTLVSSVLKKILGDGTSKREIGGVEEMEQVVDAALDEEFKQLEVSAETEADHVFEEIILSSEDDKEETDMEKRDITAVADKIKQMKEKILQKIRAMLPNLKGLSIEDIKQMLAKAGETMTSTLEAIYRKIVELQSKQQ